MVDDTSVTTEEKDTSEQTTEEETSTQETDKKNDNATYIIKRKEEKIAKLEQQLKEKEGKTETPDLEALIEQKLQKEAEVKSTLEKYPELKEKEAEIREALKDKSMQDALIATVGLDGLIELGAKRKADADAEANQYNTGGGSAPAAETDKIDQSYIDSLPPAYRDRVNKK